MDLSPSDVDVSRANYVKREIMWKYYTPDIPNLEAVCKTCDKVVLCRGGSTVSLTNHLKYAHNIIIDKVYEQLEHELNIGAQESAGNPVVRVEGIKDTAQEMTS